MRGKVRPAPWSGFRRKPRAGRKAGGVFSAKNAEAGPRKTAMREGFGHGFPRRRRSSGPATPPRRCRLLARGSGFQVLPQAAPRPAPGAIKNRPCETDGF